MLSIKFIRENPDVVKKDLEKRKDTEKPALVDEALALDEKMRSLKVKLDSLRNQRNTLSQEVNKLKKQGEDATSVIAQVKAIPEQIKQLEEKMNSYQMKLRSILMKLPNILHESVPYGEDEEGNIEIKKWGEIPKFDFDDKSHGELLVNTGLVDFDNAAKISGSGFYFLKGDLALLQQALIRFVIDRITPKGFTFVIPPFMMRRKPYEGVTDLQDFEDVMYKIEGEDLYLIATSEHPIAAMHMNYAFREKDLPVKMVGLSTNFRKEIGSRGVDTKGLFRVHQFDKVEQFVFCKPEESWHWHEKLLANAEDIFQSLEIPYRVVNICTGDIGIVAAKKYDIEAWSPRQKKYVEVVSCSNVTDYQAVRLNIKYETNEGRKYVHTLNSTALALSRALVVIVENNQQKDGSIKIPEILVPYMNGKNVIC